MPGHLQGNKYDPRERFMGECYNRSNNDDAIFTERMEWKHLLYQTEQETVSETKSLAICCPIYSNMYENDTRHIHMRRNARHNKRSAQVYCLLCLKELGDVNWMLILDQVELEFDNWIGIKIHRDDGHPETYLTTVPEGVILVPHLVRPAETADKDEIGEKGDLNY